MANIETMAGVSYDELFAGTEVAVLTKNVTVASGGNIKRGTILSVNNAGKAEVTAAGKTALYVAAEDVDASAADTVGTVYTAGYFNREKLIVASGDTVDAHEEELRSVGIRLSSLK